MTLPSRHDLNPFDDLDGQYAEEHFYGKSCGEAASLFKENSIYYADDLMWMGPVAFCYYLPALIEYLKSQEAIGDSDAVNTLYGILTHRLEYDRQEINPAIGQIAEAVQYLLMNWSKYDIDAEIYGDLKQDYQRLLESL
jgi:hypothetical protein